MTGWVEKLLDITATGNDQSTVMDALANLAERFDFVGYAFANLRPGHSYFISNYDPEWQAIYEELGYRFVDPVMWKAQLNRRAFVWSGGADRRPLSRKQTKFFSTAADFKIRSGISIPVATANGAMSMLTLASSRPAIDNLSELDAFTATSAVAQLHTRIEYLRIKPTIQEKMILDSSQMSYVRWLSLGMTVEVIAQLENDTYSKVRRSLDKARRHYNLPHQASLVAMAIRQGLV